MLFGKQWMELSGFKQNEKDFEKMKKEAPKMYLISFIGALLMAFVLAHSFLFADTFFGGDRFLNGLQAGFWSWLGFVVPVMMGSVLFEGKKVKLFLINVSYQLVSLLVMGAVIALLP